MDANGVAAAMTSMGAGGTDMPTAALFHPLLLAPHGLPLIVSERPVRRGGSTAGATAMGLGVRTALRAPLWGHRHRWRGDVRLLPEVVGSEGTAVLLCCHCRLSSKTVPYLAVRVRWEPRWRAHKAGNRRRRTPTGAVSAALMTEIQQVTALPFARVSTAVLLQASAFLCEFAKNPNLRIQICKESEFAKKGTIWILKSCRHDPARPAATARRPPRCHREPGRRCVPQPRPPILSGNPSRPCFTAMSTVFEPTDNDCCSMIWHWDLPD